MEINIDKHIWEGWTVRDFINELSMPLEMVMDKNTGGTPLKTKKEIKEWCIYNQPYYKKYIPEVVEYFCKQYKIKK